MRRYDGRQPEEMRPVTITKDFIKYPEGSVLIECGDTKVICNATVEEGVPPFKKGSGSGWVTAEYSMLPRATNTRGRRDVSKLKLSPRSAEIQRLVGRALRSVTDMDALGERTITIDCDVIQADGGTRCASITGGFVALVLALDKLRQEGIFQKLPLRGYVAAVEGHLPQAEGTVRSWLRETATHLVYSGPKGREAKEAVTRYRAVAENRGYTLAAVEIDTGRKNQIRVHMQDLGCPIAGDRQYGAQTDPMGRLALHADVLVLTDPRSKKDLVLKAPLPVPFRKLFPGVEG